MGVGQTHCIHQELQFSEDEWTPLGRNSDVCDETEMPNPMGEDLQTKLREKDLRTCGQFPEISP